MDKENSILTTEIKELPTDEKIQEALDEVDGRTTLGKRLKAIEETQGKILLTLEEHRRRIDECSIRRQEKIMPGHTPKEKRKKKHKAKRRKK